MSVVSNTLALSMLLRHARRSPAELRPFINKSAKRLLVAAKGVPRHSEAMARAGYDPERDFHGVADLSFMPLMTKSDVKRAPEAFVQKSAAGRLNRFFKDKTSGSTGTPLAVYRSPRERDIQIAKWLRVLFANGYRPTDKVISFTSPGRLGEGRSVLQRVGLLRRRAINYTLPVQTLADELLAYQPDVVYGVRTNLVMVAAELRRRGIRPPRLKLLVAGGEVIDSHAREQCREAFGVDISETYGTVEMGVMAYQVQGDSGLHLVEDCTFFEFLDQAGNPAAPGELARVVVTDLHGRMMPFIRYEQGDLATYSLRQNAAGETIRVIDRIVGRQDDLVRLPNGRILTYLDFYDLRYGYPGLGQLRVTQRAPLSFLVEVAAEPGYFGDVREDMARRLRRLSELPLEFELRRVEHISPDANGKLRMLVAAASQ